MIELTLSSLLKIAGIKDSASHFDYSQHLGYETGQYLTPAESARTLLMAFWCKTNRGRKTSKRRFTSLEGPIPQSPPQSFIEELNKYRVYQRICSQNLHSLGDFSGYGFNPDPSQAGARTQGPLQPGGIRSRHPDLASDEGIEDRFSSDRAATPGHPATITITAVSTP